jgi:hypothetical protein
MTEEVIAAALLAVDDCRVSVTEVGVMTGSS